MSKEEIKKMFQSGVHIGHRTHKWNPRMKKFIYGERNGVHIIDLEKTFELFEKAMQFLSKTVADGKSILFVSTKPQSLKLLQETAQNCHMPYVINKWIPGLLTNYPTIKTRIKYLANLKEQEASGDFDKYTKKEASKLKKVIEKLSTALGGVANMKSAPDAVFVVDVVRDAIVVKEAKKLGIPVVGIVDTNANPYSVDYPIPGNDDAIKSLSYLIGRVEETLLRSNKAAK